jgi:tetratricopeptide (TPR) repeat protein/transcriptional regulator with XRE-family HTH domain
MVPARQAVPNTRLRQQRLQRSWTLDRVAAELDRLCAREGHHAGVTGNMVGKWERGLKRPSLFYREKLCALYGTTAEDLGFLDDQPAPARMAGGHPDPSAVREPFPASVTPLHEPGQPVIRRNPAVDVARRSVLRGTAGLPGAAHAGAMRGSPHSPLWERLSIALGSTGSVNPATPQLLLTITDNYRRLSQTVPASELLAAVIGHLQLATSLLPGPHPITLRRQLIAAGGEAAGLVGWLFFSMNDHATARAYYKAAFQAVREAEDTELGAWVLGSMSLLETHSHRAREAITLARRAQTHANSHASATTRSWLAAVEAEACANVGDAKATLSALERSQAALERARSEDPPRFVSFFDDARLAGYEGICHVRLGRPERAQARLTEALEGLNPTDVKHRAIVITDLASAYVQQREVEEGCRLAGQALAIVTEKQFAKGRQRICDFRTRLDPWKSTRAVKELDEQLLATAPPSPAA